MTSRSSSSRRTSRSSSSRRTGRRTRRRKTRRTRRRTTRRTRRRTTTARRKRLLLLKLYLQNNSGSPGFSSAAMVARKKKENCSQHSRTRVANKVFKAEIFLENA